ncbi:TraB/GumN family protein [Salisediminibacterium beveridgei]|uniref:GumN Family Protein n=1 Tax=Salisediminibacterium beveridgei TaxID=632773 RepID=A0A1D7QV50_9BACI|nr:TraB/GumN family protein [Salisediminibacterium beveridgei]AOM82894.1 GumN Family Protein [Salisediminibacterium beveridgei]
MSMRSHYFTLLFFLLVIAGCSSDHTEVQIEDDHLKQAIMDEIGSVDALTQEKLMKVEKIVVTDGEVSSIEGIDQAENLEVLELHEGNVFDWTPLTDLEQLNSVEMGDVYLTSDPERNEEVVSVVEILEDRNVSLNYRLRLDIPEHEGHSKGLFYEVSHNSQTVYLFGSIHIGDENLYPIRNEVISAFEGSEELAVEIDIDSLDEMTLSRQMMQMGMFEDDSRLSDHVSENTMDEIADYTSQLMIQREMLEQFEPWFVSMLLNDIGQMQTDFSGNDGIDQYFIDLANADQMSVESLETVESQLESFSSAPLGEQVDALHANLDSLDIYEQELTQMINLWRKGDREVFEQLRNYDSEHGIEMMDERDEQIAAQISNYFNESQTDPVFVVVGALHLAGEGSIPYLLEKEGYDVEWIE